MHAPGIIVSIWHVMRFRICEIFGSFTPRVDFPSNPGSIVKLKRILVGAPLGLAMAWGVLYPTAPTVALADVNSTLSASPTPAVQSDAERLAAFEPKLIDESGRTIRVTPTVIGTGGRKGTSKVCAKGGCLVVYPATNAKRTAAGTYSISGASGSYPSKCYSHAAPTTQGKWEIYSRYTACLHERHPLAVINERGEVVGRSYLDIAIRLTVGSKTTSYADIEAENWGVSGRGAMTVVALNSVGYDRSGTVISTLWSKKRTSYWSGSATLTRPDIGVGKVVRNVGGIFRFSYGAPSLVPIRGWQSQIPTPSIRCDQVVKYYKGCVFPQRYAKVRYSAASYPTFTRHVKAALKSGLPGSVGSRSYLTRITSKTRTAANRRAACPSRLKRPKGKSCDEYPFASTKQGASSSGNTTARSFKWCSMKDRTRKGSKGFSRCFIRAGENSGAGGLLSYFYNSLHILNGDRFQVGFLG